jgi:hypothetical protein
MPHPLKTNLLNKTNADLKSLNDTSLDDTFSKSLETLINGWTQNSTNKITLGNTSDNNKYAVQFTASTDNNPGEYKLMYYVNDKINPTISNGQLNVDTINKKITFSQKDVSKQKTETKTETNTETDSESKSTPSDSAESVSDLAQKLKNSGIFNNPFAKDMAIKEHILFEEISRVKTLMKL